MIGCRNIMLSQSDAIRFEEVFSKHSGKEFSNRIAVEDIEEALLEMKVKISSEGIYTTLQLDSNFSLCIWTTRIEKIFS